MSVKDFEKTLRTYMEAFDAGRCSDYQTKSIVDLASSIVLKGKEKKIRKAQKKLEKVSRKRDGNIPYVLMNIERLFSSYLKPEEDMIPV